VFPGNQVFSTIAGVQQNQVDRALFYSVHQLIARRQATVRPGESPYRPMLRFQVHPEGLRSYYSVYPLFERMRIPMTRDNLEQ
jgi:hypothetical protein